MGSRIAAMHYCLPDGRLTQEELERRFSPRQVQGIAKLSGIMERRIVLQGQTAADLAYAAARGLFKGQGIDPQSVGLLIFCSQTPDYQVPATACILHGRLGLRRGCAAFDINQGCSAFPYALSVAHGYIAAGLAETVLILNADALSGVTHPQDRGLVTLHGDGACATLLVRTSAADEGLEAFRLGTDGSGWPYICVPASGARAPRGSDPAKRELQVDASGSARTEEHLFMNGAAVFQFSIQLVPEEIAAFLRDRGLGVGDLDLVLLHQANKMMLEQIYRKLGVPDTARFLFSERIGNLGGPSSAVVLAEALRRGLVRPGSRTLITAFGNGLSWASVLVRWPAEVPAVSPAPVDYSKLQAYIA